MSGRGLRPAVAGAEAPAYFPVAFDAGGAGL